MSFPHLRLEKVGKAVEEDEGGFVDKSRGPFLLVCQGYSNHACHIQKQDSFTHSSSTAAGKVCVFSNHFKEEEKTLHCNNSGSFPGSC